MRSRLIFPMLLAGALLSACVQSEPSTPDIAVVDSERVYRDSAMGKAGAKRLQTVQASLQAGVNAVQKQAQEKPDDEAAKARLQQVYVHAQQRYNAEYQRVNKLVNDALIRCLNAYREQHKLVAVFDTGDILAYAKDADITDAIIAALDKEVVDFGPLENLGAVPVPRPADASGDSPTGATNTAVPAGAATDKPAAQERPATTAPAKPAAPAKPTTTGKPAGTTKPTAPAKPAGR